MKKTTCQYVWKCSIIARESTNYMQKNPPENNPICGMHLPYGKWIVFIYIWVLKKQPPHYVTVHQHWCINVCFTQNKFHFLKWNVLYNLCFFWDNKKQSLSQIDVA